MRTLERKKPTGKVGYIDEIVIKANNIHSNFLSEIILDSSISFIKNFVYCDRSEQTSNTHVMCYPTLLGIIAHD